MSHSLVSSNPRRTKQSSSLSRSTNERRSPESCSSFRSSEEPYAGFATVAFGCLRRARLGVLPVGSSCAPAVARVGVETMKEAPVSRVTWNPVVAVSEVHRLQEATMFYVGLDIHDKRIAICVLGETGQIVRRAQVRTIDEMMRILEALPDRFEVCYEASCGYGHYHDLLSPIAARVTVAHPGRLRLIFRSKDKNDRKDAERLAKLLYLGEAPAVHVPAADVRTWRELITCRGRVIAKRTRAKNSLRTLLRCAGVVPPSRPALWTKKGLEWLRRLELPTASQRLRRDLLLEEVEALTRQAERIEVHLNQQAKHSPAVLLLRSIPGVGVRTAEAVAAFIDDPDRFRDAKAVGRYFGLVPSQDQSGDRNRLGHITARGAGGGPPAGRRGDLAGGAAVADGPRRTSSGCGGTTRSGRRSLWWRRRITWCG